MQALDVDWLLTELHDLPTLNANRKTPRAPAQHAQDSGVRTVASNQVGRDCCSSTNE
jgi:hypothetical protein